MTGAQRKLKALLNEESSVKETLTTLTGKDDLSDEERTQLGDAEQRYTSMQVEIRAARTLVEAEGEGETRDAPPDGEQRERIELRSKALLTNFLLAAAQGRMVSGAERELQEAAEVRDGAIPVELFDVPETRRETRADTVTPSPTSGTGVNLQPIYPLIYARSVLPRMGVNMPRTGSGTFSTATITAGLSAAAKGKGDAQESTAATLTPKTTTPHRVSARLSIALEDVATIGTASFEPRLREALQLAMADRLDHLGLTGDGQAPNPQGLLPQLTDPADPTSVVDFNGFVQLAADGIDGGPWAESMGAVRLLVNADTMKLAERTFQTATSYQGELSAGAYLREKTGGFSASSRMPATATTIAQCIRYRDGTMGLNGVNAMTTAICPVWNELGIDDIYSDSASGIRHFTLHSLIGDVVITQANAYERVDLKLST